MKLDMRWEKENKLLHAAEKMHLTIRRQDRTLTLHRNQ